MGRRVVIYGIMTGRGGKYSEVEYSGTVEGDIDYNEIIDRFEKKGYRFARSKEQQETGGDRISIGKERRNIEGDSKEEFLRKLDDKIQRQTRHLKEPKKDHKGKGITKQSEYLDEWDEEP